MIGYSYDFALVIASVLVSFMAAFTGLTLTNGISALPIGVRKTLVVMAAIVLGGGIWSMHFIAMLAMQFPVAIYYDARLTLASVLIAILLAGLALMLMHFRRRTRVNMIMAGTALGAGIIAMHFLGMNGLRGCLPIYNPFGIMTSALVAIAMGIAAIATAYGRRTKQNIFLGAIVFGLSVVVVHFAAMAGTGFERLPEGAIVSAPALANATLAMIIMLAAFVICGTFLLSAFTFLSPHATGQPALAGAGAGIPEQMTPTLSGADVATASDQPETTTPSPASLSPDAALAADADEPLPDMPRPLRLPYEQNRKTYFRASSDVAVIRAEGHYTYLYAAGEKLFCPWSISEAEDKLSTDGRFHRTHRSYLVNIEHVTGFERRKDNGACLFDTLPDLPRVPVSRTRIEPLRQALGL